MYFSFTVKTDDKTFLETTDYPIQILPKQIGLVNLKEYPIRTTKSNILIHTPYNFVVKDKYNDGYLNNYIQLYRKLNAKQLLIHGANKLISFESFDTHLQYLSNMSKLYSVEIGIEIIRFTQSFIDYINENYKSMLEFIDSYFGMIVKHQLSIIIDTAHMYANGLTTTETIKLIHKYHENIQFIHLNGNSNKPYTKDKHVSIFSEKNKIDNIDKLISSISSYNIILISEMKCCHTLEEYNEYKEFMSKYSIDMPDESIINFIY